MARSVEALEALAFVPRGRTLSGGAVEAGSDVDLLVDRFEVTWGHWQRVVETSGGGAGIAWNSAAGFGIPLAYQQSEDAAEEQLIPSAWINDVPATGMTLFEARAFAMARGMRLLTFEEWMWCAVGPRNYRYPAGRSQKALANTASLGLFRPTPVGAFESGRTPETGIYDLLGNVWEWIEWPPDPELGWTTIDMVLGRGRRDDPETAWCLGGSFLTPSQPVYSLYRSCLAHSVTEGHRSKDIGLRCVAPAADWLSQMTPGGGSSRALPSRLRRRVEAVGGRWGRRAVPLLRTLVEEEKGLPWTQSLLKGARVDGVQTAAVRPTRIPSKGAGQ